MASVSTFPLLSYSSRQPVPDRGGRFLRKLALSSASAYSDPDTGRDQADIQRAAFRHEVLATMYHRLDRGSVGSDARPDTSHDPTKLPTRGRSGDGQSYSYHRTDVCNSTRRRAHRPSSRLLEEATYASNEATPNHEGVAELTVSMNDSPANDSSGLDRPTGSVRETV